MARIIMHADLDAFFAACEEREHPEYRDKPLVVGADPKEGKGRGVVSTANYEARKFGIHSAMPISRAWKLCPQAIFVRPNFTLYSNVSERIMNILRNFADKFEQVGIDEAYLDISNKVKDFDEAIGLAHLIREKIFEQEGLTCSIGIASNKLVAKIASDYKKPDGLIVVKENEVKNFLKDMDVGKLIGVGKKTKARLNELGIKTIGDLAKFDPAKLVSEFGVWGSYMHQAANGIDESEVEEISVVKSIGREITFEEDTEDKEIIFKAIEELSEETHEEVIANNFQFKTVTVKIRDENFQTFTRAKSFKVYTNTLNDIIHPAKELARPFLNSTKKLRLIGVRVSKFVERKEQKTLI